MALVSGRISRELYNRIVMKKYVFMLLIILLVSMVIFIVLHKNRDSIMLEEFKNIKAIYKYSNKESIMEIELEDIELIYNIFKEKELYNDELSCGFSENVSIVVDDLYYFYFALDGCPVIYFKNEDKYIKLSNEERDNLFNILEKYNFKFPCV